MLTVTGLGCVRGERTLFEDLSFAVAAGGALQIEGRNGAGKSSLLRLLAGLLRPAAGSIAIDGRLAYAGHQIALKPGARLADELAFWARLDGAPAGAVEAALAAMDLAALAGLPVSVLSSGQARRAALARVIASGARLWLLDEPAVGLDTASLGRLATALAAHRATGGAVIAATHVDIGLAAPERLGLG